MRTKKIWGWLSGVGFLGLGSIGGCGHHDSSVGSVPGPVAGDVCGAAGTTAAAQDGCNTCTCGSDGRWACTVKACSSVCKLGDTKPAGDGCNTCSCTEDGTWACTLIGCLACKPGDTKPAGDGCNTCSCTDTGAWACSTMACLECKPGDTKVADDGCNTCTCSDWGVWGCTEKACLGCNPGDTKLADDGCNTCSCTDTGQWACTLKACQSPECPVSSPLPDGGCATVVVWAKSPTTGGCCQYGTPCDAPAGWPTYYSAAACEGASCPAPADPGGRVCPAVEIYAKDPNSGLCCQYSDPCHAPEGWKTFTTATECNAP